MAEHKMEIVDGVRSRPEDVDKVKEAARRRREALDEPPAPGSYEAEQRGSAEPISTSSAKPAPKGKGVGTS